MRLSRSALRLASCAALLGLLLTPALAAKFTIAVISDTQNYTDVARAQPRGIDVFMGQMRYLVDTRAEKNLVFVTHVGDVVQHGDGRFRTGPKDQPTDWNTRAEWMLANRAISILSEAGLPFGLSPGNHDYDNYAWPAEVGPSRPLAGGKAWNAWFGPNSSHFAGKRWYGGASPDGLSSYQQFSAGGKRFLHLSLEMEASPAVLDWAQGVINHHQGQPTIVTTHEWLDPNFTGATTRSNDNKAYFDGAANLPPDQVWERFIRRNDQIFLVLAGHDWTPTKEGRSNGENLRIDQNDAGYPVYQTVQDYQGNTIGPDGTPGSDNGGAGWMRFIEFDTRAKTMHFYTYSTLLGKHAGREGEATFGATPQHSDFILDFPPQLLR